MPRTLTYNDTSHLCTLQNAVRNTRNIALMYFPVYWFQGNSMCIKREQSRQLCPYNMGTPTKKQRLIKHTDLPKYTTKIKKDLSNILPKVRTQ